MAFATKAKHSQIGDVIITEQCYDLQTTNPDPTTMFVSHDGEIKEVSKNLVSPMELTWLDNQSISGSVRIMHR